MSKFIFRANPKTGLPQTQFPAKLEGVATVVRTLNNIQQTPYRNCSISFANDQGVVEKHNAIIYEKNYSHGMTVGKEYLCTASKLATGGWIMNLSHLEGGGFGVEDTTFGFDTKAVVLPARQPAINNVVADLIPGKL